MVARKYLPKWELTHTPLEGGAVVKNYFSITDIVKDYPTLDRQVIYRIRKDFYTPTNYKGSKNKAFEKYRYFSIKELTGYKILIHREVIREMEDIQE
tara:strand:- start:830 stop:1120 length:291 start_codon:yes stop_codon:yes gene_type:complete